jgi:lipopolysaccharide/colanic/teichoic acid biosynthesis glycosyltransferase
MTRSNLAIKHLLDFLFSGLFLMFAWPIILITWILARRDTGASGFFVQERVGKDGRRFKMVKIRTMLPMDGTVVTTKNDARITPLGAKLRRWKLDEFPQLWNVVKGDMSFVGPRPEVPAFANLLQGDERLVLSVRPGITGPATLKYRDEEEILANVDDPERYNKEVIWPDKIEINLQYLREWSLARDIGYVIATVIK